MTSSPGPSTHWHSVTPHTRPLCLTILELTPLALTLSLSLASGTTKPRRRRPRRSDSDDELTAVEADDDSPMHSFRDLLNHGVVVTLNGQPWTRIVAHVDEEGEEWDGLPSVPLTEASEEGVVQRRPRKARFMLSAQHASRGARIAKESKSSAVVVIYGLSPGKEYEVELRIVGVAGEETVSNTVLIPSSPNRSRANSLRSRSRPRSRANSEVVPPPGPVTDEVSELRLGIVAAHEEKDQIASQMKDTRRSAQKAEASLRQEIEAVKKAIEKAGAMDMRAKQKSLALQEQVKQGWAGAENAEKETVVVDGGMEELEARLEVVKLELDAAKDEYQRTKQREEEVRERDRRARVEEDKKLADIAGKVDKLKSKKDKRESEKAELEKRLEELERQGEEAERRNEDDKNRRQHGWDHTLQSHPSMPNMGFNRRNYQQPRFASGSARPAPFPNSPGYRPKAVRPAAGVNPGAAPFLPGAMFEHHTTSLMPPQLQHRIFPPAARPRQQQPAFNPTAAGLDSRDAAKSSPTSLAAPAFPPLPGGNLAPKNVPSGPSLASIVTRAVLSPTSAALGPVATNAAPIKPGTGMASPTPSPSHISGKYGAAGPEQRGDFAPASPPGWGAAPPPWGDRSSPHSSGGPSRKGTAEQALGPTA